VVGTALGCGGYALALLVYIFNRGQYHPMVRPAVLTSALGYTMAAIAINFDVGRTPYIYKIPVMPHWWNLNSVLLEVALCVMAYCAILWIELSPALFETWRNGRVGFLRWLAEFFDPIIRKLMIPILAIGVLAHHAPVVAGHGDAPCRQQAAPALEHRLGAAAVPDLLHQHGLRRGVRVARLLAGVQAPARDRDAGCSAS
jgi:hypothetical protein